MIYEINTLIDLDPTEINEIKLRLKRCGGYWKKIIKQSHRLIEELDPKIFYYSIRPNLKGFTGIRLQGAYHGDDVIATSVGGTGGNDPSFQIF